MTKRSKLTPVEWEIMECVWELGEKTTARDVFNHAFPNGEKAYTTVQTILNTLYDKGMLKREKIGMVNFYSPQISRKNMVNTEFSFFLSRVFKGSVQSMANFLINSGDLDLEDIQTIKEFIEKREKELRSRSS